MFIFDKKKYSLLDRPRWRAGLNMLDRCFVNQTFGSYIVCFFKQFYVALEKQGRSRTVQEKSGEGDSSVALAELKVVPVTS